MARTLERTYGEIRAAGSTAAISDTLMPFDDFNALIGLEERYAADEKYRV